MVPLQVENSLTGLKNIKKLIVGVPNEQITGE
jgi:hypothetical protein